MQLCIIKTNKQTNILHVSCDVSTRYKCSLLALGGESHEGDCNSVFILTESFFVEVTNCGFVRVHLFIMWCFKRCARQCRYCCSVSNWFICRVFVYVNDTYLQANWQTLSSVWVSGRFLAVWSCLLFCIVLHQGRIGWCMVFLHLGAYCNWIRNVSRLQYRRSYKSSSSSSSCVRSIKPL